MKATGWIKLWRKLTLSDLWLGEPFTRGQAWVDLILMAVPKTVKTTENGVTKSISQGIVITTTYELADRWKWNRASTQRFLCELEKNDMISMSNQSRKKTIIYIKKWSSYQGSFKSEPQSEPQIEPANEPQSEPQNSRKITDNIVKNKNSAFKNEPQNEPQIEPANEPQSEPPLSTLYKEDKEEEKKEKEKKDFSSGLASPLGGEPAQKTREDIPPEFRADFETYEAYIRWREQ